MPRSFGRESRSRRYGYEYPMAELRNLYGEEKANTIWKRITAEEVHDFYWGGIKPKWFNEIKRSK